MTLDAGALTPFVTWGTNPAQAAPLGSAVPDPATMADPADRAAAQRALAYMDLAPGTALTDIAVDTVFVGSCTNGRLEDLRAAAEVLRGRKVASGVRMLVVPGSMAVKAAAEQEGLAEVFTAAGAQWRSAGCSMCLGMNPDTMAPGERSASTSNRNFEGRQGEGARTHLVSPQVAAATAVTGRLTAPADLLTNPAPTTGDDPDGPLHHAHRPRRAAAAQQRGHRPDHPRPSTSSGSAGPVSGRGCSPPGGRTPASCSTSPRRRAPRSSSPAPISGSAPPASTPSGPSPTTGSGPSSPPGSGTSSTTTRSKRACSRCVLPADTVDGAPGRDRGRPGSREITVDLAGRQVRAGRGERRCSPRRCEIDDYTRWRLMEGLDDIR